MSLLRRAWLSRRILRLPFIGVQVFGCSFLGPPIVNSICSVPVVFSHVPPLFLWGMHGGVLSVKAGHACCSEKGLNCEYNGRC